MVQTLVYHVSHADINAFVTVYIDDLSIVSKEKAKNDPHMDKFLSKLRGNDMYRYPKKCESFNDTTDFLACSLMKMM